MRQKRKIKVSLIVQPMSCYSSLYISPGNIRKSEVLADLEREQWHEMG